MGMGVPILVVKRDALFAEKYFQGFIAQQEHDFLPTIRNNFEYHIRTHELENDDSFQQPIPYVWIVNPKNKTVFLYKRDVTGNEGRLHNKYSGGVGGHIDKATEEHERDPIHAAMMRELKEEVAMKEYPAPKIVGFLNDDADSVGRVHFGIVAIAETTQDVRPVEDMKHGQFYTIEEVEALRKSKEATFETWTELSWEFVKAYLTNQ